MQKHECVYFPTINILREAQQQNINYVQALPLGQDPQRLSDKAHHSLGSVGLGKLELDGGLVFSIRKRMLGECPRVGNDNSVRVNKS